MNDPWNLLAEYGPADSFRMHWRMLRKWHASMNLTAPLAENEAVRRHYLDSLSPVLFHVKQRTTMQGPILDIGSGAGFPGIPLAIALPDVHVTLLEPRRKRASFLNTVAHKIGLKNIRVVEGRSDDGSLESAGYLPSSFGSIVSRAVFSDVEDMKAAALWVQPTGSCYWIRGAASEYEGNRALVEHSSGVLEVWSKL